MSKHISYYIVMKKKKRPGYLVKTKTGLVGRTYHDEPLVNGKQPVHTENGKLLCDPKTVTVTGFID